MMHDRRLHTRFPTLSVIKSIDISCPGLNLQTSIPAIMFDLSAGGIALITFCPFPIHSQVTLNLELGTFKLKNVEGEVVRTKEKKQTYLVAIQFTNLAKEQKAFIAAMAENYAACETRILHREEKVCFPKTCSYYQLCSKPERIRMLKSVRRLVH